MPQLKAHRVSFFLASGGFNSVKKVASLKIEEMRRMHEEPNSRMPESLRQGGYTAREADGEIRVTFEGSKDREPEMLAAYTTVLRNCTYEVQEADDPERAGRRMLKVVSTGWTG
jgi:hypothetical protein